MTRRVLVSDKLPPLRSGNAEIDRWVEQYLQAFVSQTFEQIKFLTPEKGTFTPIVRGSGTAGTYEIGTNFSRYYRMADLVIATIDIVFAGAVTGGGTGTVQITGLPFVAEDDHNAAGALYMSGIDLSATAVHVMSIVSAASSLVTLNEIFDNAAAGGLAIGSIAATDRIITTIPYLTTGVRA